MIDCLVVIYHENENRVYYKITKMILEILFFAHFVNKNCLNKTISYPVLHFLPLVLSKGTKTN